MTVSLKAGAVSNDSEPEGGADRAKSEDIVMSETRRLKSLPEIRAFVTGIAPLSPQPGPLLLQAHFRIGNYSRGAAAC